MDVDKSVEYIERILRVSVLKKYIKVLVHFKDSVKGLDGYQWTLGSAKGFSMEEFWVWAKLCAINIAIYLFSVLDCSAYFEKYLWF